MRRAYRPGKRSRRGCSVDGFLEREFQRYLEQAFDDVPAEGSLLYIQLKGAWMGAALITTNQSHVLRSELLQYYNTIEKLTMVH